MNNSVDEQKTMYCNAVSKTRKTYEALMEMINDPVNPIGSKDIYAMIKLRPERYSQFKYIADELAEKEEREKKEN
jgi:hypothetical protein